MHSHAPRGNEKRRAWERENDAVLVRGGGPKAVRDALRKKHPAQKIHS